MLLKNTTAKHNLQSHVCGKQAGESDWLIVRNPVVLLKGDQTVTKRYRGNHVEPKKFPFADKLRTVK